MARARATTNSRLSVDDWVQAGFAILAEEGIKALKIDRLCRRLGVTKGSFYWHFTAIAGYRAALVQARGELRVLMPAVSAAVSTINPEFAARLADRAQDAERLRRLPPATIDLIASGGFTELRVPVRYGGIQAGFPAILDRVRRMAHGCASSAWTIGFYAPHNWILRT
jgi:AcrR family transcriptional regulator